MLLRNLEIRDFRGFHHFRIPQPGRVNLLVGTNNYGKTSILEAVSFLAAVGEFSPIWHALRRRGEEIRSDVGPPPPAACRWDWRSRNGSWNFSGFRQD
ncbi:AAA family ATPase [Paludisphaera rhizosphaerae]|uniref:AAA family ATPase n=1 Tax=Paludisphaera rhizosphaerae TaxID=2711216 RepID=UPI0013E9B96C|nr:AAA family ATPase [Paludisphaera rhizosphaerae]